MGEFSSIFFCRDGLQFDHFSVRALHFAEVLRKPAQSPVQSVLRFGKQLENTVLLRIRDNRESDPLVFAVDRLGITIDDLLLGQVRSLQPPKVVGAENLIVGGRC